ncbi:MAG TPA: hypothetical protein VGR51_05485 [Thermoplasmata archaeon]|nr:hypothetical protein [Thermoplasmata archaeon]
MGMTYVRVRFSRKEHGVLKAVRLLVDTGAFYSLVPGDLLTSLGVRPLWRDEFEVADGSMIVRPVGKAYVHYRGEAAETLVIFGQPGDATVLGCYALEGLRLEVVPHSQRLRRKKHIPLIRLAPLGAS